MDKYVCLVLGGISGTLARYVLAGAIYQRWGTDFPYGTLVVNLIGCFLIGFLDSLAQDKFLLGPQARVLLMAGFCGAFTTFSTLILESANLMKDGEPIRAFLNIVLSVIFGLLIFRLGEVFGKLI